MTRRWTLALFVTLLVFISRAASAGQAGEPAPGLFAVMSAATPAVGSLGVAVTGGDEPVHQAPTRNDAFCLTCHGDPALETRFADGSTLPLHVDARALRDSAHGFSGCLTCHADSETYPHQPMPSSGLADYQARAVQMCVSCHLAAASGYAESAHGAPVLSGTGAGATCNDCHSANGSAHSTSGTTALGAVGPAGSVAENCGRCHATELATYRRTAHGKLDQLADKRRAATCTDCHGAHGVSTVDGASGAVASARRAVVCPECHPGADAQFASEWLGHEASASPSGLADYAHRSVVLLMAVGVCFGLTHVTLDFLRNPRRPGGRSK